MGRGDEVINLEDAKIIYNQFSRLLSPITDRPYDSALSSAVHRVWLETRISGKTNPTHALDKVYYWIINLYFKVEFYSKSPAAYVYTTYMKICPIL